MHTDHCRHQNEKTTKKSREGNWGCLQVPVKIFNISAQIEKATALIVCNDFFFIWLWESLELLEPGAINEGKRGSAAEELLFSCEDKHNVMPLSF